MSNEKKEGDKEGNEYYTTKRKENKKTKIKIYEQKYLEISKEKYLGRNERLMKEQNKTERKKWKEKRKRSR